MSKPFRILLNPLLLGVLIFSGAMFFMLRGLRPHKFAPPVAVAPLDSSGLPACTRLLVAYYECSNYQALCKEAADRWAYGHASMLREWCFDVAADHCKISDRASLLRACPDGRSCGHIICPDCDLFIDSGAELNGRWIW